MMRSQRDTARTGHKGCRCCYPVPDSSTLRQRERQWWMADVDDESNDEEDK